MAEIVKRPCPMCGRENVRRADGYYRCSCSPALYDDAPHEGGGVSDDPEHAAIKREEYENRQRQRRAKFQTRR